MCTSIVAILSSYQSWFRQKKACSAQVFRFYNRVESFSMETESIQSFLEAHFHLDSEGIELLGAGMFSKAFAFQAGGQAYVLRVSACEDDFLKDRFAYQHYSTSEIPIPKTVSIGHWDHGLFYCITERCAGWTLNLLQDNDLDAAAHVSPALFDTLDAIHRTDISRYEGWGLTGVDGHGLFADWRTYMLSLHNQKFDFDLQALVRDSFIESELFASLYTEMESLLVYCPDEKWLMHGDFGFDNVISDGERITGVLDWAECGLGDFVSDIAYLQFWSDDLPYGTLWREYAAERGRVIPRFEERMRCYTIGIALGSMLIAAHFNNREEYESVKASL
jgi:hygromycin-B 4-O-kinase